MADFPALPCETIVFRGALYKNWVKGGRVRWQAFQKKLKDIDGVSLAMLPDLDKFEGLDNPLEGVISTHVGYTRDISIHNCSLDVIQDKENHAFLSGLLCSDEFEGDEQVRVYQEMKDICLEIAEKASRVYSE